MNIYLIYGAAVCGIANLLIGLLVFLKPRLPFKLAVKALALVNLTAVFWLAKFGFSFSIVVMAMFIVFLTINAMRYGSGRLEDGAMTISIWLNMALLIVGLAVVFGLEIRVIETVSFSFLADAIIGISFVGALTAAVNIMRTILKSRLYKSPKLSKGQRPTVTVAIAARNEDHALSDCLNAVLSSDYEKMEVLVLDDCSADGTGSLMRFYANSGVRFISGEEPPLGWLGQNWANERLLKEASGDYIIFVGADTRISPHTISRMVQFAKFYTFKMVSVQPMLLHLDVLPQLLRPLRLLWQTTFRSVLRRPPVSSGLWMIEKQRLEDMGGFEQYANVVGPERLFAAKLYETDSYFYAFANADDGIVSRKKLSSMWDSAIRSYYPHTGKNPALVCYMIMVILSALLVPALSLSRAVLSGQYTFDLLLGSIAIAIWWISHMILVTRVSPSGWFLAIFNLPIMVVVEVGLHLASLYKYEFGEVVWKGRNICWLDKELELKLSALTKLKRG